LILPVDQDPSGPAQVIEPDVIKTYISRLNTEQTGSRPLITNSDVAEPNGPVTMIKQGTRDYADRIREIQNPGILGG
jgi:hypothetical protein